MSGVAQTPLVLTTPSQYTEGERRSQTINWCLPIVGVELAEQVLLGLESEWTADCVRVRLYGALC